MRMIAIGLLLVLACLVATPARGETEAEVTRELRQAQAQLKAVQAELTALEETSLRLGGAMEWKKGVLAVRSQARNLSPLVLEVVKMSGLGLVELRATRGIGNKPGALRVVVSAAREPALTARFSFLEAEPGEDGMVLQGVMPLAPGASLENVPPTSKRPQAGSRLEKLRQQRDECRARLARYRSERSQLATNKARLAQLRSENRKLAKQVGWHTLDVEKPELLEKHLKQEIQKSLGRGMKLTQFSSLEAGRVALAHQVAWPAARFEVTVQGFPEELAGLLARWESFGLDRPALLESVALDEDAARVRLVAFLRRSF